MFLVILFSYIFRKEHQPVNFKIKQLDQMLHKAGAKAIPKYRKIKSLKTCGKGIWNSKISQKSKEAKRANWHFSHLGFVSILAALGAALLTSTPTVASTSV
jgi:hypothetical protein